MTPTMDERITASRKLGADLHNPGGKLTPTELQQCRRVLIRRGIAHSTLIKDQIARGRPSSTWAMCGNDDCDKARHDDWSIFTLREETYQVILKIDDTETQAHQLSVESRVDKYVHCMVRDQFHITQRGPAYTNMFWQIRTFIDSPPVRAIFSNFSRRVSRTGWTPTPEELAMLLTSMRPAITSMLRMPSFCGAQIPHVKDAHYCFQKAGLPRPAQWRLSQYVMEFFLCVESWRRYARRNIAATDWTFKSEPLYCELLISVLMNEWCMLQTDKLYDQLLTPIPQFKMWDDWLDRHIRFETEDLHKESLALKAKKATRGGSIGKKRDKSEEVYVIGGRGQLGPSWESQRIAMVKAKRKSTTQ